MPNETITDLRAELFKTLRGLTDKDTPMEIERARAVADIAQTIINSAKVEVDYLKATGTDTTTGFITNQSGEELPTDTRVVENKPGVRVLRHTFRG